MPNHEIKKVLYRLDNIFKMLTNLDQIIELLKYSSRRLFQTKVFVHIINETIKRFKRQ